MNGLAAPLDDLLEIAKRHPHPVHGPLAILGDAATAKGAKIKKLVIAGEVSPMAAKALKKGGWTVVQLREGLRASR